MGCGRSVRVIAALLLAAGQAGAACSADKVAVKSGGSTALFSVEIADTPDLQARGLMFREKMPSAAGMLFVFPKAKHASFWMKNTLIGLDIIFADSTGQVTRVHSNAVPQDETAIDGGEDVLFVLEINAGLADRMGISQGSLLQTPFVDQNIAAWPCATP